MSDKDKDKDKETEEKSSGIAFFIGISALAMGGYIDVATNETNLEPSTDNSNPEVVAKYEQRLSLLEQSAIKQQAVKNEYLSNIANENFSLERSNLLEARLKAEGIDFMGDIFADNNLSEANVVSLRDTFSQKILPINDLGEYSLAHPEYLDEAKVNMSKRDLASLDKATSNIHKSEVSDGPWMGVLFAFLLHDFLLVPIVRAANEKSKKRKGNNPKTPKRGSSSFIGQAIRRLKGKPPTNH